MDEKEQIELIYSIYDLPPKTQKEADRNFVWALLKSGCPPFYILAATERMTEGQFPDDAYEEDEEYDPENEE